MLFSDEAKSIKMKKDYGFYSAKSDNILADYCMEAAQSTENLELRSLLVACRVRLIKLSDKYGNCKDLIEDLKDSIDRLDG